MHTQPIAASHSEPTRVDRCWLVAILTIAGLLRLGIVCWKPDSLLEDRDLYWGIANRIVAGDGFIHPELGHVTAYRPPLYPLLLALIVGSGGGLKLLATVQITLSTATVWLTWMLGCRLNLGRRALIAAAFVAINPLLVQATALAMTETLFTFLVTACLLTAIKNRWLAVGLLSGLAAMCRPTMFAFVGLAAFVFPLRHLWLQQPVRQNLKQICLAMFVFAVVVAPWGIRNWWHFGKPIVTTTHGGYTLLLGNNDEAYQAEATKPLGAHWDSQPWQKSMEEELQQADISSSNEVARDRWMSERAWAWITSHPREFTATCWLRIRRFWNISPAGPDAVSLPKVILWGISIFYAVELIAASLGLLRLDSDELKEWSLLALLVISLFAVHIVYWSNMRMRAPLETTLALLAARSTQQIRRSQKR